MPRIIHYMAKITKSSLAPDGALKISAPSGDFTLDDKTPFYETDDPAAIADAQVSPFLDVEVDEATAEAANTAPVDELDPANNPSLDIQSAFTTPEVQAAAAARVEKIQAAAGFIPAEVAVKPSTAEFLASNLEAFNVVDDKPATPAPVAPAPVTAPSSTTPSTTTGISN